MVVVRQRDQRRMSLRHIASTRSLAKSRSAVVICVSMHMRESNTTAMAEVRHSGDRLRAGRGDGEITHRCIVRTPHTLQLAIAVVELVGKVAAQDNPERFIVWIVLIPCRMSP